MKTFCKYFVFAAIGVLPNILAGYNCLDWEWWAVFLPLMIGVNMHVYALSLD